MPTLPPVRDRNPARLDRGERLTQIAVPTLLVSGAHDEATPATMRPFQDGIADVRWEIFPKSGHMAHIEEEEDFLSLVGDFLHAHD
jgi:L-proline amide hydrolase